MTSNLKVIVSAMGVAALLASPAMAKTEHHRTVPSLVNVPADAHASASTNGSLVTVYAPDVRVQAHPSSTVNPDFQLSSEK
jgi:hypothetical protein